MNVDNILKYVELNQVEIIVTVIIIPILIYMIKRIFKWLFGKNNNENVVEKIANSNTLVINTPQALMNTSATLISEIDNQMKYEKSQINILFIDDDTTFKVVKILKQSGWINTKLIKDLKSLSMDEVMKAHILFTDIRGVGKLLGFQDEGLGLAAALKEKYPDKMLVIYSSEQTGNRFHKGFRLADDQLAKNAEPYEFISTIERLAEKLKMNGKI